MPTGNIIRNFYGERIGELRKDWRGNTNAYDRYNMLIGTFNPKLNITTEYPSGRIVSTGDTTTGLIWNKENERLARLKRS